MSKNEDQYAISDIYGLMSEDIIREKRPDILACGISVGFISCEKAKTINKVKAVLGECKKISPLEKLFCPFDFLIIIYDPNCEGLNKDQMMTLLWHELNHIGIDEDGEPFIVPHDVEEFDDIIKEKGLHWAENVPRGTIGGKNNGKG